LLPFTIRYLIKFTLVTLVGYLIATQVYAQRTFNRPPKFKKNKKMAIICPIFLASEYPYQGIGVKIGDPFAITYKLYVTENLGLSIDVGSAASGLYSKFHRSNFANFPEFDTVIYQSHDVKSDLVIQARFMLHSQNLDKLVRGLDWYIGAGFQFRDLDIEYQFIYEPNPTFRENLSNNKNIFSSGPEIILGIEYSYFQIPLSAFAELNLFRNIDVENAKTRLQGGIGLRYVF